MKKRLVLSVLASILVLSMFTACGANKPANKDVKGTESPTSTETTSTPDKKPKLNILTSHTGFDPNKDIMHEEIVERTGYDVEYFLLPQDNPDEKLNLEIASGTNYDILVLTPQQFYKLAAQGALQPLDDIIAEHGKNMKEVIYPDTWGISTYNGAIYGVPQKNERPNIEQSIGYRKDILDELNLKAPETIEEFYETLKAVKKAKPDMIPLTGHGSGVGVIMATITSAFGIYTDWSEVDGQLVNRVQRDEMKDYLAFMARLYAEGLADQDWGVNKAQTMQEKLISGRAFAMPMTWGEAPGIKPALVSNVPEAELEYLNPLQDENGNAGIQASLRIERIHAVPKKSKNAVDAIKFIDSKLDPENFTYLTLGVEGQTFTKDGDVYAPIMPIFSEKRGTAYYYLNGIDETRYADMWLARVRRDPALFEAFDLMNKEYDRFAKSNPIAFASPHEAVSKYQQSLRKLEEDYIVKVIMGVEKADNYAKFQDEWLNAGGLEVTKAVNE